ncbi:hypothetical protein G6F37_014084 [Rhizopus arrhizus]|nr:hypothetical protein G6F38_013969 [Rhizopus arrhizus]KAG1134262.1 hypothetical protein G6F37_014084 [Rhizopus arrhizus]
MRPSMVLLTSPLVLVLLVLLNGRPSGTRTCKDSPMSVTTCTDGGVVPLALTKLFGGIDIRPLRTAFVVPSGLRSVNPGVRSATL